MTDDDRRPLQRDGVVFFGAMGAGLSHELSNVFNIINELSGLQQDIIQAAAESGSASLARVADLASRIKSQVVRGEEINRSLHRLSHSVDDPGRTFDLGETLVLFGALAARSARLAEVDLEVRPTEDAIEVTGDPFALLLVMHACLRSLLAAASDGRSVGVRAEVAEDGPQVIFESADPPPDPQGDAAFAATLAAGCAALGAVVGLREASAAGRLLVIDFGGGSRTAAGAESDRKAED